MLVTWGSNPAYVLARAEQIRSKAGKIAGDYIAGEMAKRSRLCGADEYCDEPVQSQGDLANPPS